MTSAQAGGVGLSLTNADEDAFSRTLAALVEDKVASRIAAKDATLWGPAAEPEASKRLAWVTLATESRPLVEEIAQLRTSHQDQGLDHVVLCGMGGSSLAPEVICGTHNASLTVLDSSDPDFVREAIADSLDRTVVVVSSKSGGTVETDSQKRAYEQAFREAGIDPTTRIVVVTDPGSPLSKAATADGYRVFHADPDVGGRYSALTAFGLVPSGLAGADISLLLDEAAAVADALAEDSVDNPGLRLGALLGAANAAGADKVVLAENGSGIAGFGDWAEQLIAESTGKDGKGILPVVVPSPASPNFTPSTTDEVLVTLGPGSGTVEPPASGWGASLSAPVGAALRLWEYVVPVASRLIGVNPFDQPDVESAKQAAREMLEGSSSSEEPAFTDGPVEVFATQGLLAPDANTVADAVSALVDGLSSDGYLAVMAYLDRTGDASLAAVRESLARRTGRPTTFGWGPRFLHSTGQYHKGGPANGCFLQITSAPRQDLDIPGRPFSFGTFIQAQAVGDATVLAEKGMPVLRLHLTDHDAGLAVVQEVLGA